MDFQALILLTGAVLAIAAVIVLAKRDFFRVSKIGSSSSSAFSASSKPSQGPETQPEFHSLTTEGTPPSAEPTPSPTEEVAAVQPVQTDSIATVPIQEAPAPFPEEQMPSSTSIPTDITAVGNAIGPSEIVAPLLVIPTPKRRSTRRSTKRLPSHTAMGEAPIRRSRRTKTHSVQSPETVTPESSVIQTEQTNFTDQQSG